MGLGLGSATAYILISMSPAEMIVLFLSLRYFATDESKIFDIPSRYIFYQALHFLLAPTQVLPVLPSYIGSSLLAIIIFLKLSPRPCAVYGLSLLVVPSGLCSAMQVRLHSLARRGIQSMISEQFFSFRYHLTHHPKHCTWYFHLLPTSE